MISLRKRFTRGTVLAALIAGALGATAIPGGSAQAATSKLTPMTFTKGKALTLSGLKVSGFDNKSILAVISMSPEAKGTLSISNNTFLTLSYGYTKFEGAELSFTAGNQDQMNAALASMSYTSPADDANAITLRTMFAEAKAGVAYFPANQHFYEVVRFPALTSLTASQYATRNYSVAETAAKAATQFGLTGYLANISSKEENDFVSAKLAGAQNVWIGGSDATTEGTWIYTDGPDKDKQFWSGNCTTVDGAAVAGAFAQWAPGEPNNWVSDTNKCGGTAYDRTVTGGEDCIVTNWSESGAGYESGYWNDVPCDVSTSGYTATRLQGYVIEYGNSVNSATYPTGVDLTTHRLVAVSAPQTVQPTLTQKVQSTVNKIAGFFKPRLSKKVISPAEQRRRIKAAKEAEKQNGKLKLPRGGKVGLRKTKCGTYYVIDLSLTAGTKIGPKDRYSFYFINEATNKFVQIAPCSTIGGLVLSKYYAIPVVRPQPGQTIAMSLLTFPADKAFKGTRLKLNLIYQELQADFSYKLSRSELAPKEPFVLK